MRGRFFANLDCQRIFQFTEIRMSCSTEHQLSHSYWHLYPIQGGAHVRGKSNGKKKEATIYGLDS